jgi:hypothetical protein
MFKKILKLLAAALVIFLIIAGLQPSDYKVERSLVINAPASAIFAQVNNLHAWEAWSPWAKLDPNAKITFEGPRAGKGAIHHWDGNNEIGAGSMEITESSPYKSIQMKLDFLKPMKGTATSGFTFTPEGNGTKVTWSMEGKRDFLAKVVGLIMSCDAMIGDMYDKGLANLKTVVKG